MPQGPGGLAVGPWGNLWQSGVASSAVFHSAGPPTNGVNGTYAGLAGTGAVLSDTVNSVFYQNTGTKASPVWTAVAAQAFIPPGSTNISVGAGQTYPDLNSAWQALNNKWIPPNASVYFQIAEGVINATSPVLFQGPNSMRCTVQGATPAVSTVTSVQSSSGSPGAYSIILNVGSVAGISVGNYAFINTTSGGTNPRCLEGCWAITNVDAVNTRITITSTLKVVGGLPSGAVAGTLTVLKSVLSFTGCDGLEIWNAGAGLNLQDVVLVGDGSSISNGLSLQDVGRVYTLGHVGIVNWGRWGVYINYNSEFNSSSTVAVTGCVVDGCFVDSEASLDIVYLISNGNGSNGVLCDGAYARGATLITCGNTNAGCLVQHGGKIVPSTTGVSSGNGQNGYKFDPNNGGLIDLTNTSGANNVANLYAAMTLTHPAEIDISIGGTVRWAFGGANNYVTGQIFSLQNPTPSTTATAFKIGNDGSAKVNYYDGAASPAIKWELGHHGAAGSYAFSLYGDVVGGYVYYVKPSNNYIGTLGNTSPTVPLHVGGAIRTTGTTVAGLIAAATAGAGARHFVTDSTVAASGNFGAIVAGGGANGVPVWSDGTNWLIG